MALMLLGIGLFAAITATITSYFVGQGGRSRYLSLPEQLRALTDLRADGALTEDEFAEAKLAILRERVA